MFGNLSIRTEHLLFQWILLLLRLSAYGTTSYNDSSCVVECPIHSTTAVQVLRRVKTRRVHEIVVVGEQA